MDLVQTLKPVKQKHSTIEQQFNFERPIDAVDVRYAKEAVNHDQVAKGRLYVDQFSGQTKQVSYGEGKNYPD